MKIRAPSVASLAVLAALWGPAAALSEDWFDDAMKQSFPHAQSVMSVVLRKPDPCQVAVKAMVARQDPADMFDEIVESVFPNFACRGQIMFTQADEEECMAIQNSPEIETMIEKGIAQPQLVCGWRKFWIDAKASEGNNGGRTFDSCELCERTVQMIENEFEKQELAVEVIEEALKVLCHYLPEGSQCKTLLTRFDDIIKYIKEGLSPHHVCEKITMCQSTALLARPAAGAVALRGSHDEDLCTICRDNTNAMRMLVDIPHGLDLYKGGMDSVCEMASETKTCRFMTTHFHQLAAHLRRGDDAITTCNAVNACGKKKAAVEPTFLSCVFCEFVGEVITSALHQGGPQTLPIVKLDVDALCNNLPASAHCQQMDDKFDELADLMAKGKKPEVGCEAVRMCSPVAVAQNNDTQAANLLSVLDKLVVALDKPYELTHYVGCTTCEHTAYAIEQIQKSHKGSLPMLKKSLKKLCHFLPPCTECKQIVKRFDDLAALLKKGLYAKPACIKLGFCEPEKSLATPYLDHLEEQVKSLVQGNQLPGKKDAIGCIFCQYTGEMITQVSKYSKDVVPLLKLGVETLCTKLPKEAKCRDVVEAYDTIAELIEAGKSSLEACQNVQLCDAASSALTVPQTTTTALVAKKEMSTAVTVSSSVSLVKKALKSVHPTLIASKSDEITCAMCDATAESIETLLKYNKELIPVFKIGMEVLCDRFQTPQCINVMPEFDHLVELVESGKNFVEACEIAKLCGAKSPLMHVLPDAVKNVTALETRIQGWMVEKPTESNDAISCLLCEYTGLLISQVAQYDKDIVPFLKQGIGMLCAQLPVKEQCEEVVEHFDALAELVESGTIALNACFKVHLCSAKSQPALPSTSAGFVSSQLALLETKLKAMEHSEEDTLSCVVCEDIASLINTVVKYNKDLVPLLKTGLQVFCTKMQQLEAQCNGVLEKFDQLVPLIEDGVYPLAACRKVQLCDMKAPTLALESHVADLVAHPEAIKSDESCLFCQYASQSISAVMKLDKGRLPMVHEAIGAMCSFLPPIVQCDDVNEHFEELAKSIESGASALLACHKIALCETAPTEQPSPAVKHAMMKIQVVIDEVMANQ